MSKNDELVIEFHYTDGDVGSYIHEKPYPDAAMLWNEFSKNARSMGFEASHIVIRKFDKEKDV